MNNLANRIKQFNSGRNSDALTLKYRNMRSNAFVFYRGSCHLFYEDLPDESFLESSPVAWNCGDLHLENFGGYKADNRGIFFDINDFDEGALSPCLFDVARVLTSIILAAETLSIDQCAAEQLCKQFLDSYVQTLQEGSARLLDEKLAQGKLKKFLASISHRKRKAFINSRTVKTGGKRKLRIDDEHVRQISKSQKQKIKKLIADWAKHQENPEFYTVLDAGWRIAGTGSLGLERYVLLIKGNGAQKHYLLDMKIANPSCLNPYLKTKQPLWNHEAERIIQIQKQMQIFPQAFLNSIQFDNQWFVLKELQPSQDKMDLRTCHGNIDKISRITNVFAAIVAWGQLRSSGRLGSAPADDLMQFANHFSEWREPLLDYATGYALQVQKDYKDYSDAYDTGFFND